MADMYFDDFEIGRTFRTHGKTISEAEILTFAMVYDPQPLHMNAESAKDGIHGGLISSGFQTISLSFSLFFRLGILDAANLGSPGFDELRWLKPVRPGDTIWMEAEVTQVKPSKSKPDRGVIFMDHRTVNQNDEVVMTVKCMHMLRRRPDGK
ncbi:MAG: MaoC family dehydratase [Alphaproteobacteria bacterium]|jgi:acyl dehydratase|nr:MaoC family dehydratase [Alphaproteobacteria bacterium]MBT4018476.1 MaoC family dehydratase [Alphaproteobacteria bacterium]MBT5161316.1 MaoC family dehydratase [Alphaproteobacteria bacterium]MBT5918012.1 MaoC family dehydratase [Alphaproteobacteria bacterium]MBT6386057.1 MaoC family dehydratase [Alphaproteobacteria bacterium]